jgi:serine/threonine protein kinase/Flp pilus assembly protein TadD
MPDSSSEVNPLDVLAEEFVERHRRGERPSMSDYTEKYPALASEIRDLFPALVVMEQARPGKEDVTVAFSGITGDVGKKLERLGDYRILREVGRGGMGIVYEAEQESLGRHVALKVLPAHALLDPVRLQRFQREAKAAARLHHTNIVPVYGVGEHDGLHYYVMQFIQGLGLDLVLDELKRLREFRPSPTAVDAPDHGSRGLSVAAAARSLMTGRFTLATEDDPAPAEGQLPSIEQDCGAPCSANMTSPVQLPGHPQAPGLSDSGRRYWESIGHIGIQVADALEYASAQGTLHRDIKPSNLLLDGKGTVWVTDFGLAKASDSKDLTHTGDIVGTLRYMAPERFNGLGDIRSDIYSLGLTLYELLAVRPAFDEADRNKLIQQVLHDDPPRLRKLSTVIPRDLETIVHKAIDKDPARRYPTPHDFAEDLQRFVDDRPIRARRASALEKTWRWCRRNPAVAMLTAALVLVLLGAAVGSTIAAFRFNDLADREATTAANERQARADADANADQLRSTMTRLYRVNALLESGRGHVANQRWIQARDDLDKAVELLPEYALVWRERAYMYFLLGLEEEAFDDLAHVFELQEPDVPELWLGYAGLLLDRGDEDGYRRVCARLRDHFGSKNEVDPVSLALTCTLGPGGFTDSESIERPLLRMVASDSAGFLPRVFQAAIYFRAGRLDDADQRLTGIGVSNHEDPGASLAWSIAALVCHKQGREVEAKRFLERVEGRFEALSARVPMNQSPDSQWFLIELMMGRPLYREAYVAIHGSPAPETPGFWKRHARSHGAIGRLDKAAADLSQEIERRPSDPELYMLRGANYAAQGLLDKANTDWDQFLALNPKDPNLLVQALHAAGTSKLWDRAAEFAAKALESSDRETTSYRVFTVYSTLSQGGEWDRVLARVAELCPKHEQLRLHCGRDLLTEGRAELALTYLDQGLALNPKSEYGLSTRADANGSLGRWKQAAEDLAKLHEIQPPKYPDEWLSLAFVRAYLNDREGYQAACKQMISSYGTNSNLYPEIGLALAIAPDNSVDREFLKSLFASWPEKSYVAKKVNVLCLLSRPLADYRFGNPAQAEVGVRELLEPYPDNNWVYGPIAQVLLSITEHRLGRAEEARRLLRMADESSKPRRVTLIKHDFEHKELEWDWSDRLCFLILRREAEALLKQNAPPHKE